MFVQSKIYQYIYYEELHIKGKYK